VVIDQNESHFLRQQAARIRAVAQNCTRSVSEELLAMARELDQRAREIEGKAD
jgi:hypothetical protein